jgi:hypothetical protein
MIVRHRNSRGSTTLLGAAIAFGLILGAWILGFLKLKPFASRIAMSPSKAWWIIWTNSRARHEPIRTN